MVTLSVWIVYMVLIFLGNMEVIKGEESVDFGRLFTVAVILPSPLLAIVGGLEYWVM